MPDSPVWPPRPVYLATLRGVAQPHAGYRDICSEGVNGWSPWRLGWSSWFLVGELPDGQATIWCKNIPEKLNPLSRVHARYRRQTTDRRICHAAKKPLTTAICIILNRPVARPVTQLCKWYQLELAKTIYETETSPMLTASNFTVFSCSKNTMEYCSDVQTTPIVWRSKF